MIGILHFSCIWGMIVLCVFVTCVLHWCSHCMLYKTAVDINKMVGNFTYLLYVWYHFLVKPSGAELILGNITVYLHFALFFNALMVQVLEGEDLRVLHRQYHDCWWSGNAKSQGICNHSADLCFLEYSDFSTRRVASSNISFLCWRQLQQFLELLLNLKCNFWNFTRENSFAIFAYR